jgi:hypothetical protein
MSSGDGIERLDLDEPGERPWPVGLNVVGTVVFCLALAVGVPFRDDRWAQVAVIVTSMVLFAIGLACAIWAYALALERSRTDEIGVANLFLLTGETAPRSIKRLMAVCLAVQVVTSLAGAAIGAGGLEQGDLNPLAFGILVPMLGIGLNGMYGARYGRFGARRSPQMRPPDEKID